MIIPVGMAFVEVVFDAVMGSLLLVWGLVVGQDGPN